MAEGNYKAVLVISRDAELLRMLNVALRGDDTVEVHSVADVEEDMHLRTLKGWFDLVVADEPEDLYRSRLLNWWKAERQRKGTGLLLLVRELNHGVLRVLRGSKVRHVMVRPVGYDALYRESRELLGLPNGVSDRNADRLSALSFFSNFPRKELEAVASVGYFRRYGPGESIIPPQGVINKIGVVAEGWVRVSMPGKEGPMRLNELGTGRLLGETTMLVRRPSVRQVDTETGCEIFLVPYYGIELLPTSTREHLYRAVIGELTEKLLSMNRRLGVDAPER